jgi:enoyl-CoA hydratase/carnithine racemase
VTGRSDPDEAVVKSHVAGQVGHVLLNRPEARNAITVELAAALADAVGYLAADESVRVILLAHLTREGDTAFAAFERRKESA